jgi:hypothetical protein
VNASTPQVGQTGGVVMAMTETLVGAAITVGVMVTGVGAHMWRRISVLETHREHEAAALAELKSDVKGIDAKVDTVLITLGAKKGR